MKDIYIGIDPGQYNGVAIYDEKNGLRLCTLSFWKLIEYIDNIRKKQVEEMDIIPHFYVENPGLNQFIYSQKITNKNKDEALRIAQNVGMNKQDTKRIIERINFHEMIMIEIRPNSNSQKWTAEYFNSLMRGRFDIIQSNQHVRDAAKLISAFWSNHKITNQLINQQQ